MSKFNKSLADIAFSMFDQLHFEKEAFVPMDPASQQQAQGAPQGDPSQGGAPQGAPQGDPSQGGGDPSQGAAGAPPAVAGPGPGAGQGGAPTLDDIRATVRQEVEAANEKPKKQSVDERLTALEGAFLRLLQHLGLLEKTETDLDAGLPQDADKMQQEAQQQQQGGMPGMGGGGAPGGDPSMGAPTGAPSGLDMSAGGGAPGGDPSAGGMPKMGSLNDPFRGLAAAVQRLRNRAL